MALARFRAQMHNIAGAEIVALAKDGGDVIVAIAQEDQRFRTSRLNHRHGHG